MFYSNLLQDRKTRLYIITGVLIIFLGIMIITTVTVTTQATADEIHLLDTTRDSPLIIGSNQIASNLRSLLNNDLTQFKFDSNLSNHSIWGSANCTSCNTDLKRLNKGGVNTQIFTASINCNNQYRDGVARTLEQIDVIKRLVNNYPEEMELVYTADSIWNAYRKGSIGSLLKAGGGYAIDSRLGLLRILYDVGVRVMTLTPGCNTAWIRGYSDTQNLTSELNLTTFGEKVVYEMNRLGMIVDLTGSSPTAINHVLQISKAPVVFTHSAVYSLFRNESNVRDETLLLLKNNGGILMITFDAPNFVGTNTTTTFTVNNIIDHIEYIVDKIGVDYIGIGGNFDSGERKPKGYEDVSTIQNLLDKLQSSNRTRWTDENVAKLAGTNFIRVFEKVEQIRDQLRSEELYQSWINDADFAVVSPGGQVWQCRTRN